MLFFLREEKFFREIYNWNVQYRKDTDKYLYDVKSFKRSIDNEEMDITKEIPNLFFVMFNKTLIPFYLIPLFLALVLLVISLKDSLL